MGEFFVSAAARITGSMPTFMGFFIRVRYSSKYLFVVQSFTEQRAIVG
jgi:hypothetical protein